MMDNLLLVALASAAPLSAAENAALYGASTPATLLPRYRRGWDYCTANLCGGAERLGALLEIGDLRELGPAGADKINDAVRAYGVVVIKGQNLTRAEQVKFTGLLGEPVALAKSFYGKDPEPNQPSILRVTNFWANGTWKGTSHKFGEYWHQDGQFWAAPKHNMLSIVHAQQVPPRGGETGFVDMRAARATLSAPLLERAAKAAIHASVREIKDFRGGDEEDFAMFPKVAVHPLLANHYVDSGPLLYVGSPHMKVHGCVEINQ